MSDSDSINYGRFMERAMRGVLRDVMGHVAENGLPGSHHFYITFDTTHPGVDLPDWLVERYPSEMTVVMQDWYDNLAVTSDRFTVTLNFSDQPETLVIPFNAVATFIDPSVKFGLKFDDHDPDETVEFSNGSPTPETPSEEKKEPKGDSSADVVRLDTFRKS